MLEGASQAGVHGDFGIQQAPGIIAGEGFGTHPHGVHNVATMWHPHVSRGLVGATPLCVFARVDAVRAVQSSVDGCQKGRLNNWKAIRAIGDVK